MVINDGCFIEVSDYEIEDREILEDALCALDRTFDYLNRKAKRMKEERLYELAYEALSNKWGREYDFLKEHPENEISQIRERELWNELIEFKEEMKVKGWH